MANIRSENRTNVNIFFYVMSKKSLTLKNGCAYNAFQQSPSNIRPPGSLTGGCPKPENPALSVRDQSKGGVIGKRRVSSPPSAKPQRPSKEGQKGGKMFSKKELQTNKEYIARKKRDIINKPGGSDAEYIRNLQTLIKLDDAVDLLLDEDD